MAFGRKLVVLLTKPSMFGKQNNQLPTKSHVELKDNSIIVRFLQSLKLTLDKVA